VGIANLYYFFDFTNGHADGHTRGFHLAVRPVRNEREPQKLFVFTCDLCQKRRPLLHSLEYGHCDDTLFKT
jgi:hypothetical protein